MISLILTVLVCVTSSSSPPGHGQPLGLHNNLGSPALEDDFARLSALHFVEKYVATRTPVILRGLAKTFSAFTLWTDDYIREHYGDMELRLEAKTEKESFIPVGECGMGRATFTEFLDRYKTDNMYCVSEVPGPMYKELELPAMMNCGTLRGALVEMNMWINSGGAKSIIHKDAHNQLNCLLDGSKDWIFINNSYNDGIYQAEEIDGDQGGYSLVNPDQVNYITFPKFAQVPWTYATVHAGDCLYLPPRYYHRVKSTNRNFAVSYLFGTKSTFEMSGCDAPTSSVRLDNVPVEWVYPGHGVMSMGNSSPYDIKQHFIETFLDIVEGDREGSTDLAEFIETVKEMEPDMPYVTDQLTVQLIEKKVFGSEGKIDLAFLEAVSLDIWMSLAAAYSYDPANDPDAELYHIEKHEVVDSLKDAAYYENISQETFLTTYQSVGGSPRKGRELFDEVSSDGQTVSWYDVDNADNVFDMFGQEHDRGDYEMYERNMEIVQHAKDAMVDSVKYSVDTSKAEL